MFGTRWSQTFSTEPLAVWSEAFEDLTNEQIRYAIKTIAKSGNPHPPSLPETLGLIRQKPRAQIRIEVTETSCTPAELMANRWVLSRSLGDRFAGIDNPSYENRVGLDAGVARPTLDQIRRLAVENCGYHLMLQAENDPEATPERIWRVLDGIAESYYPLASKTAWRSLQ